MANVILFGDNTPRNIKTNQDPWYLNYSSHTGGTAAIASHLRKLGYTVLIVPHCTQLSLAGIKKIISDNKHRLLWVGLSTSLFMVRASDTDITNYRSTWSTTDELLVDPNILIQSDIHRYGNNIRQQLAWGTSELNQISKFLKDTYRVPFLIGGAWISTTTNGGLANLDSNIHCITGRAEKFVEATTISLAQDRYRDIPLFVNNDDYDNNAYNHSSYVWVPEDNIQADDWLPLEIARGCAFNCAYCTYDRKSTFDAYKNPKVIREELIRNYELYGVTRYMLVDDLYNDSKDKVRILYDKVWSNLPFTPEWTSFMRLDMLWSDPESAEIIKHSGARMGSFGIETLHNKAGSKIGKGLGKARIIETLELLKEVWSNDVLVHGLFITGLPEEPEEHILETIKWLKSTDLLYSYYLNPLMITPESSQLKFLKHSDITLNNDAYGISWTSNNNWINRQGVTFDRAVELVDLAVNHNNIITFGYGDYSEFRKMGFTHAEIANFKTNGLLDDARQRQLLLNTRIKNNLLKILKII